MHKLLLALLLTASLLQAKKSQDIALGIVTSGNDIALAFKYHEFKGELGSGSIGVDKLVFTQNLIGSLSFFMGVGLKTGGLDSFAFRAPIGVSIKFSKHFDIFAEFLPALHITPELGFGTGSDFGLRYFF